MTDSLPPMPAGDALEVEVQNACEHCEVPDQVQMERWARAALGGFSGPAELVVRIVDEAESTELNSVYRHKTGPTNVLSFPSDLPAGLDLPLLGDLVICAPVVAREAREQDKPLLHHWGHMVVHGILHLRGYDHQNDEEAAAMESLEREILAMLDIDDPYTERDAQAAG